MVNATTQADRLAALHAQLAEQVRLLRSGEDWTRWLRVAARFHRYSFQNTLAILAARPDATHVAGYRTWQSLGRQVTKGEHGIPLLAPVLRRTREQFTTPPHHAHSDDDDGPRLVGFRIAYVWDVTQTSGDPLPEQPTPALLVGQAPDGLWDALATQVTGRGFTLSRGACGPANGITDFAARTVRVRDDIDDAQAVKSLAHELGHVLLHDPHGAATEFVCRGIAEVEAESVAHLVLAHHGVRTDAYTFPYVTSWADGIDGQRPEDVVTATAQRVLRTAGRILDTQPTTEVDAATLATTAERGLVRAEAIAAHRDTTRSPATRTPDQQRDRLLAVHADAAAFYAQHVMSSWVPGYLRERGLAPALDAASPWRVGHAPAGWTPLVDHLRNLGYRDDTIEDAGLAIRARTGRLVDRFRDRLMLPIRDVDGRVIAFVGRAAPDAAPGIPKYLNSPTTSLFHKAEALLGLAETRLAWQSGATPVLVEGPLDAIAVDLVAHGHLAALSPCGTALTPAHARAIAGACTAGQQPTVALDADPAGRTASRRALALLTDAGLTPNTADLPPGHDPASALQAHGPQALRDLLEQHRPLADAVVDATLDLHAYRLHHPEGRLAAVRDAVRDAAVLPAPAALQQVCRIAARTGLPVQAVTTELARHLDQLVPHPRAAGRRAPSTTRPSPARVVPSPGR
jgi:DNA primase